MPRAIDQVGGDAKTAGLRPAMITKGWLLPELIGPLIDARLATLIVSIASHSMAEQKRIWGRLGLGERIGQGLAVTGKERE